jgi:hypothetical protein
VNGFFRIVVQRQQELVAILIQLLEDVRHVGVSAVLDS